MVTPAGVFFQLFSPRHMLFIRRAFFRVGRPHRWGFSEAHYWAGGIVALLPPFLDPSCGRTRLVPWGPNDGGRCSNANFFCQPSGALTWGQNPRVVVRNQRGVVVPGGRPLFGEDQSNKQQPEEAWFYQQNVSGRASPSVLAGGPPRPAVCHRSSLGWPQDSCGQLIFVRRIVD